MANGEGVKSYWQGAGSFIKEIGLPGAFAIALLYIVAILVPEAKNANQELRAAILTMKDTVAQQVTATQDLTRQIVDHRLRVEGHPDRE